MPGALVALRQFGSCDLSPAIRYIGQCFSQFNGPAPMLNDIYNKQILQYAADIHHLGRLEQPDASATAH